MAAQPETLKSLTALVEADERQAAFAVFDTSNGTYRKRTLEDLYEDLSTVALHNGVPEEVRSHFAIAQNLVAYSWFFYPFNVAADLHARVSVEFALRITYSSPGKKSSLKSMVRRAVSDGRIRESGFSHFRESDLDAVPEHQRERVGARIEEMFLDGIVDSIPGIRNRLAHGANMNHMHGLRSLRFCAEFINQLFERPRSEA